MSTFVILRHPVNILVIDFTNRDNLTNKLLILKPSVLIFNSRELFSECKKLMGLNLSGTYQGESSNRPPSCTTSRQLTIDILIT